MNRDIKLDINTNFNTKLDRFLTLCDWVGVTPLFTTVYESVALAILIPERGDKTICDEIDAFYKKIENDIQGDATKFLIIKSLGYMAYEFNDSHKYLLFFNLGVKLEEILSSPIKIRSIFEVFKNKK